MFNQSIMRAIELANEQNERRPEVWKSTAERNAFYGSDFESGISATIASLLSIGYLETQA